MSTRQLIEKHFDAFINETFKEKDSIKLFLLAHNRKEMCINNITSEIFKAELKSPKVMTKENLEFVATEFARTFCNLALKKAEEDQLTDLQRSIQTKKAVEKEKLLNAFENHDNSESL